MAALSSCPLLCVCHVSVDESGPIIPLKDASWEKLVECAKIWRELDGLEREVAEKFVDIDRESAGYHRRCYQKFTDKRRIGK